MKTVSPILVNRWLIESSRANIPTYLETHGDFLSPQVHHLVELSRGPLRGISINVTGGWRDFVVRDGIVTPVRKHARTDLDD